MALRIIRHDPQSPPPRTFDFIGLSESEARVIFALLGAVSPQRTELHDIAHGIRRKLEQAGVPPTIEVLRRPVLSLGSR